MTNRASTSQGFANAIYSSYRSVALRVTLLYFASAGAWLFISTQIAARVVPDTGSRAYFTSETVLWGLFVVLSGGAFFLLVRNYVREIADRESAWSALVDHLPEIVFRLSPEGTIESWNRRAESVTGLRPSQLRGRSVFNLLDAESQDEIREAIDRIGTDSGHGVAVRLRQADGSFRPYLCSGAALYDAAGALSGIIGTAVEITELKAIEAALRESADKLKRGAARTVHALAILAEKRDPYTAGHQDRVAELCLAIAGELGLPEGRKEALALAASVHDIGKIGIPLDILNKTGSLMPAEMELIKAHPRVAYEVLKTCEFSWPIADIVLHHHERYDGSGYPDGIVGEAILLECRIMAVADTLEAMTSHRPYRPAGRLEAALEEIESGAGKAFDPAVVRACLSLFRDKGYKFARQQ